MKSIKDVSSLLSTLEFLEHVGAGDPIADLPSLKSNLELYSAKKLLPKAQAPEKLQDSVYVPVNKNVQDRERSSAYNSPIQTPPSLPPRFIAPQLKEIQSHLDDAKRLAQGAKTLPELKAALESFQGCGLKHTAMNTVFADGNVNADIMLIGEAPGADEDRQGLPFVGTSGQLLDNMLYSIGKNRKNDFYISNVIPWRPPGNLPPTTEETRICLPFIQRHIELKKPKVLIFVGATAAKTLLGTKEGMSKLRGKWFDYIVNEEDRNAEALLDTKEKPTAIPSTVLFHPSYLLRSPGQKKHAWADLLKIKKAL